MAVANSQPLWLPADILIEFFYHLPRQSDVAVMMRTSKMLHSAGITPLLRFGVTVKERNVKSFLKFLLKDPGGRAPRLRKLNLDFIAYNSDSDDSDDEEFSNSSDFSMRQAMAILRMATGLESLDVHNCEEWLQRSGELASAISSLHQLRRLTVSSVGTLTARVLRTTQAPLAQVQLLCLGDDSDQYVHALDIVKHHQSSLEKLCVSYAEILPIAAQFPNLRALALCVFERLDVSVLHQACPNLRFLRIFDSKMAGPAAVEKAHEDNRKHRTWAALDQVCGRIGELYGLGLSCPVRRVDIEYFSVGPTYIQMFHSLISHTTPSHLLVQMNCSPSIEPSCLSTLFDVPAAKKVTHLVVDIPLYGLKCTADDFLDEVTEMLSRLSVTFFTLRLHDLATRNARVPSQYTSGVVREAFKSQHHDAVLSRFIAACPRLKHVSLDIAGNIDQYWAVHRAGGNVRCVELDLMVGRNLMAAEGIALRDWEVVFPWEKPAGRV